MSQKKLSFFLLSVLAATLLLTGCSAPAQKTYEKNRYIYTDYLDTVCVIDLYLESGSETDFKDQIAEKLQYYHQLFDAYHSYDNLTNVYSINQAAGEQAVAVPDDLYRLLQFCIDHAEQTKGRTDISMGAVTKIWKQFMERIPAASDSEESLTGISFPSSEELEMAKSHSKIENILLDEEQHTVHLTDPDMLLDVGAVAKGYVAEQIAAYIRSLGVESACIDLGGNVKMVGKRLASDGRTYWTAAVRNPETREQYDFILKLEDTYTLVTSGNYERFVMIDGVRYSHLIDPDTLWPVQEMASVTILATDSALADYLSTALFSVSVEEGREILSHYDNVEAFWVTSQYETFWTDGFESHMTKRQ